MTQTAPPAVLAPRRPLDELTADDSRPALRDVLGNDVDLVQRAGRLLAARTLRV